MQVHHWLYIRQHVYQPSCQRTGTHLHPWVGGRTVRVKCLAPEHNTMTPVRGRAWIALCRVRALSLAVLRLAQTLNSPSAFLHQGI